MTDQRATDAPMFDSRGQRRTASLFAETTRDENLPPVYTMKDYVKEGSGLISAYEIYMNSVDEYDAAMRLVGSMNHWRKLCSVKWFMEGDIERGFTGLNQWREDLALRDTSNARRLAAEGITVKDLKAASLMLDIASGKKGATSKTKQTPSASSKTSGRRGSQKPAAVVDINSLASKIQPE